MYQSTIKAYEILGLNQNAPREEIKTAYRQLAKQYHPDRNKNQEANDKFIQITEAYKELMNPDVKKLNVFGLEIMFWEDIIIKDRQEAYRTFKTIYNEKIEDLEREYEEKKERGETFIPEELWKYNFKKHDEWEKSEIYKKYRWTSNKLKLLGNLNLKLKFKIHPVSSYYPESELMKGIVQEILLHLRRVLNGEVDIKEKIINPGKRPDGAPYEIRRKHSYKQFSYKIRNQFHPKFLNKLPEKAQIFVRNKMYGMCDYLEEILEDLELNEKGEN